MSQVCRYCKGVVSARGPDKLAKAMAVHEDTCPAIPRVKK